MEPNGPLWVRVRLETWLNVAIMLLGAWDKAGWFCFIVSVKLPKSSMFARENKI